MHQTLLTPLDVVGAITVARPSAAHPDAALFQLAAQAVENNRLQDAALNQLPNRDEWVPFSSRCDKVTRKVLALEMAGRRLRKSLADTPALTLDGLRAKARFLLVDAGEDPSDPDWSRLDVNDLTASILCDLLRDAPAA
jgi:hypothetical protein